MGGPHLEVPGTIFIVLGVGFVVLRGKIAVWFNALSERIGNSERSKQCQGIKPRIAMKPTTPVALGVAWILSGIMMLFLV